jgi:hypothetical protein
MQTRSPLPLWHHIRKVIVIPFKKQSLYEDLHNCDPYNCFTKGLLPYNCDPFVKPSFDVVMIISQLWGYRVIWPKHSHLEVPN